MSDIQNETLNGGGRGAVEPQDDNENENGNALEAMAKMMTPEERQEMISILQRLDKDSGKMTGELSLDEGPSGDSNNQSVE